MRNSTLILLILPGVLACLAGTALATGHITWKASGKGGAVAAGHPDAVAAGIRMLEAGGNAADAAAATLLALSVTDYGMFAIGGEIPFLIYDAEKKEVKVLSGLGRAPLDQAAIDWYYTNTIPAQGSMKAAPTPGAVDLCITALKLYGTKSFAEASAPVLEVLDAGSEEWHPKLAVTFRKLADAETKASGTREEKLTAARDRFYKGDVADELEAWYIATGSFLRKKDLAAHVTRVEDPVSVDYRGYTVYKCPSWTQGPALCQALTLLEGFDLKQMGHLSASYIHTLTESMKLAFADRDEYYGDPLFAQVPMKTLLSREYARVRRALIDPNRASLERRPGDPYHMKPLKGMMLAGNNPNRIPISDTTTCVVADKWGNVVAATPSCNLSGNLPGPSGVTTGNRLRSLNTTRGHPNRIQPGKRPRITLTPTLVTRNGKPVIAISVAGGDLQDQTTLNVLLNHVEFGMLPDKAVTASRFNTDHLQNSFDPNPNRDEAFVKAGSLRVHSGVGGQVQEELKQKGHRLTTTDGFIARPVMLYIDHEKGVIHAAGDPAAGRHAAAIE